MVLLRRFIDREVVIELGTSQAMDLSDITGIRANHICASECSWRFLAGCTLGYDVLNRKMIPISDPVSERLVFLDLGRQGYFGQW